MREEYRKFLTEGERAGAGYSLGIPREAIQGTFGQQLGTAAGSSVDFKDYREYQPGDDLRNIDWNVFARSDKLTVKLFREEVNPHLDLVLDCSKSMALPGTQKARATLGLAGLLVTAAANARCSHCVWMNNHGYQRVPNSDESPSAWDGLDLTRKENPAESFAVMPPRFRKNSIRILLSDLLWMENPTHTMKPLVNGAAAVLVVQILATEDVNPSSLGNIRIVDVESGEPLEIFIDAVARKRYQETLAGHSGNWHDACRQTGARMATVTAEEVVDGWRISALEELRILESI